MANLTEEALRDILVLFQEVKRDLKSWRNELQTKTMANQGLPVKPTVNPELIPSATTISSTPSHESLTPSDLAQKSIPSSPVIPMTPWILMKTNQEPVIETVPNQAPPITLMLPPISPEPPDPLDFSQPKLIYGIKDEPKTTKTPRPRQRRAIPLKYSCEEIHERMTNGLCVFCDEIDTPSHFQLKHRGFQILVKECDDDQFSDHEETEELVAARIVDDDTMVLKQTGSIPKQVSYGSEALESEKTSGEMANDLDSDETTNTSVELSLGKKFVTVRGGKEFEENMLDIVKLSCQVKEGEKLVREHLNEPGSSKAVSDQIKARNQAAEEQITALRCLQSTFATAAAYYKHLNVSIKRFPVSLILDEPISQSQLRIYSDVEVPQHVSAIGNLVCTEFMLITMSCWRKLLRTRRKHKWSKLWRFRSKDKLGLKKKQKLGKFWYFTYKHNIRDKHELHTSHVNLLLEQRGKRTLTNQLNDIFGEASLYASHKTKHKTPFVSYVWHRWKDKAEISQSISVFIVLVLVNSQPSEGYGLMMVVSWTLAEAVFSCYNVHKRVYFLPQWLPHDHTIWDCHHLENMKLFLGNFVLSLVVGQRLDCSLFGHHSQWKWHPPEQFYQAFNGTVVLLWTWVQTEKFFSARWLVFSTENKKLKSSCGYNKKTKIRYLRVVVLKSEYDLHVRLKREMFLGFLTKTIAEKEKHLVMGACVVSLKTGTVQVEHIKLLILTHDEMVEACKLIALYKSVGIFCNRSVRDVSFASLLKGNTTNIICYFTIRAWESAVTETFQMSFSFKVTKAVRKKVVDIHDDGLVIPTGRCSSMMVLLVFTISTSHAIQAMKFFILEDKDDLKKGVLLQDKSMPMVIWSGSNFIILIYVNRLVGLSV